MKTKEAKSLHKRLAVAFTGPSNSGKTTLILKVARKLIHEHQKKVSIIKNDPKDKAHFDIPGKDSYKFSDTGADVIVTSPTRTTLFAQQHKTLDEMVNLLGDFDLLLVEGLKTLPLPRISVFRHAIDENYYSYMNALAIDATISKESLVLPTGVDVLDLNNTDEIISWIFNHAKEI